MSFCAPRINCGLIYCRTLYRAAFAAVLSQFLTSHAPVIPRYFASIVGDREGQIKSETVNRVRNSCREIVTSKIRAGARYLRLGGGDISNRIAFS
jgi:hypothetical protein